MSFRRRGGSYVGWSFRLDVFFFLDSLDFFISSFLLSNSRKSVRWSVVPTAPKLVNVRCEGERGSGPEGAENLCWARI